MNMCLRVKWYAPFSKVAKTDIECYKVLCMDKHGRLFAPFMMTSYELGTETPKVSMNREWLNIMSGVHTFISLDDVKQFLEKYSRSGTIPSADYVGVFKSTIPAGSTYYKGTFNSLDIGNYTSSSIIVDELVEAYEVYEVEDWEWGGLKVTINPTKPVSIKGLG